MTITLSKIVRVVCLSFKLERIVKGTFFNIRFLVNLKSYVNSCLMTHVKDSISGKYLLQNINFQSLN